MAKNNATFLLIAFGAVALLTLSKKAQAQDAPVEDANPGNGAAPVDLPANTSGFPIVYGRRSEAAKALQKALGVAEDGIIGPVTLAAWRKYDSAVTASTTIPDLGTLKSIIWTINVQRAQGIGLIDIV